MERYARFFRWINIVNKDITKEIASLLNYDKIDETMKEYFERPPSELSLFVYSIGVSKENKVIEWLDKNVKEIKVAEPLISIVYSKLVENCIKNSYEVNIFGHNNSFEGALLMLVTLNEYNEKLCSKVLEISIDKIIQRISNLCYSIDFSQEDMTYNFLNYIKTNYSNIFLKIINLLDIEKVKHNIKENYDKIVNNNDNRKEKMINEFNKILNIYKENNELKKFCDNLISE